MKDTTEVLAIKFVSEDNGHNYRMTIVCTHGTGRRTIPESEALRLTNKLHDWWVDMRYNEQWTLYPPALIKATR